MINVDAIAALPVLDDELCLDALDQPLAHELRTYLKLPDASFAASESSINSLLPRLQEHHGASEPLIISLATAIGARYEPQAAPDHPGPAETWYRGVLTLATRHHRGISTTSSSSLDADLLESLLGLSLGSASNVADIDQARQAELAVLEAQHGLARIYDTAEQRTASEAAYRSCVSGYARVLGPRHPRLAAAYNNLGMMFRRRWIWEPALANFQAALDIFEYHDRQRAYSQRNSPSPSRQASEDGDELQPSEMADSAETLMVLHNMGSVYNLTQEVHEAREMLERALRGRQRVLGNDDPETLETAKVLAGLERNEGRFEAAERMYRDVLRGYVRQYGARDSKTLDAMVRLGFVLYFLRREDEALKLVEQGLKGQIDVLGGDHPNVIWARGVLAKLYNSLDRLDEAEREVKRALKSSDRRYGASRAPGSSEHETFGLLGEIYEKKEMWPEFRYCVERELEAATAEWGADSTEAAQARSKLVKVASIEAREGPVPILTKL